MPLSVYKGRSPSKTPLKSLYNSSEGTVKSNLGVAGILNRQASSLAIIAQVQTETLPGY